MRRLKHLISVLSVIGCTEAVHAQPPPAQVTARSSTEALQWLFDNNIHPGGPFTGDGALIAGTLAGQSLTFPVSSSASGFTFEWSDALKRSVPTSNSFGPIFAERGITNGRHNLSVNVTYQRKTWTELGGLKLPEFGVQLEAIWVPTVAPEIPAGTLDELSARVDFTTDVAVFAGTFGVTDRIDVGVSLPWVRASVSGTKRMFRTVGANRRMLHTQDVSGESSGLGDILLRTKWNVLRRGGVSVAAVATGRLPTGRTAKLYLECPQAPCSTGRVDEFPNLGLGKVTGTFGAVASSALGRWSPHVNVLYGLVPKYQCDERFAVDSRCRGTVFQQDGPDSFDAKYSGLSNEWNLTAGADYVVAPRVTGSFDVIARRLIDAGIFKQTDPQRAQRADGTLDPRWITQVANAPGHIDSLLYVAGVKVNVGSRWLVTSSVLFPGRSDGLKPGTTWVVGLDRAIVRR